MEYVKRKEVLDTLKISYPTLYKMAERKEIETAKIGQHMLYNLNKYLREKNITKQEQIVYCRVSSNKQKEELQRQVEYMKLKYPTYTIIQDIGSSLNFNRKGLKEIIDKAINGKIEELVIAYKDRLCRIGFELIEMLIKNYSKGKITIIHKEEEQTPAEEMTKDIISIMNVYVAKINGLRKYKKEIKKEIKNDDKKKIKI
jgi:predicted site-specific integrase-resolvase